MSNSGRRAMSRALKGYHSIRVEMDRRWDANKARYGVAEPAYHRPEDFPPGKWAAWVEDRPGSVNVVAWRRELAGPEAPESPVATVVPAEIQETLF